MISLKDIKAGFAYNGLLVVKESSVRLTRNQSTYLHLVLTDGSRTVRAKKWDYCGVPYKKGTVVVVSGTAEEYNGSLDLTVADIRQAYEHEYTAGQFLPVHPDRDSLWKRLVEHVESIKDGSLREFLQKDVFGSSYVRERFLSAPAASTHHHAFIGGLLCHTVSVTDMCFGLACRRDVDRDMLLAGALVHDIGKIEAYDWSGALIKRTDRGELHDHIILGVMLLSKLYTLSSCSLARNRFDLLLHMVVSHHGTKEKGSPVEPRTAEAEILHYADELDATLDKVATAREGMEDGEVWTERIYGRQRRYYICSAEKQSHGGTGILKENSCRTPGEDILPEDFLSSFLEEDL